MKKIVLVLMVVLSACAACMGQGTVRSNVALQRQKIASGVITNISVNDTTVNTDTSYLWYGNILGWNIQVQWTAANVSGTTGGTVIYQGSPDNVNWYTVLADVTQCSACTSSTTISSLTSGGKVSNAAVFKSFPFRYFRVQEITSGTQTSFVSGSITEWSAFETSLN